MKVSVIWFKDDCFHLKKKGLRKMDTWRFSKGSQALRKGTALFVAVRPRGEVSLHLRVVEGRKRTREVGEEQGNVLRPARPVSPPVVMHEIAQWAGSVSRTESQSCGKWEGVWVWVYMHVFSLLSWFMWKDEWAQRELFISVFLLWAISEILDCGFIYNVHSLLKWHFSQVACG